MSNPPDNEIFMDNRSAALNASMSLARRRPASTDGESRGRELTDPFDRMQADERAREYQNKEFYQAVAQTAEAIMRGLFPALFDAELPDILKDLTRNISGSQTDDNPSTARLAGSGAYWDDGTLETDFGKWTGVVRDFYGNIIDTVDLSSDTAIMGTHVWFFTGLIANKYTPYNGQSFTVDPNNRLFWKDGEHYSGSWPSFMIWKVADEVLDESGFSYTPKRYVRSPHTAGDIRIPVPLGTAKFQVVQQGSGSGGDNGVVMQFPRTH